DLSNGLPASLHLRPAEPLRAADGLGADPADRARGRPRRQHLPGGDADPRGDAVVRAEDRRRRRGARRRRAVDADLAGLVPATYAPFDPRRRRLTRRTFGRGPTRPFGSLRMT